MSSAPQLPPLVAFDEACRLVVEHLKREVPLALWAVSRYDDGKQIFVHVRDDAYGTVAGGCHAWSDSLCRHMVAGRAPQIAPRHAGPRRRGRAARPRGPPPPTGRAPGRHPGPAQR